MKRYTVEIIEDEPPEKNKSFKLAFKALATLINLTYYYCHKDKGFFRLKTYIIVLK